MSCGSLCPLEASTRIHWKDGRWDSGHQPSGTAFLTARAMKPVSGGASRFSRKQTLEKGHHLRCIGTSIANGDVGGRDLLRNAVQVLKVIRGGIGIAPGDFTLIPDLHIKDTSEIHVTALRLRGLQVGCVSGDSDQRREKNRMERRQI